MFKINKEKTYVNSTFIISIWILIRVKLFEYFWAHLSYFRLHVCNFHLNPQCWICQLFRLCPRLLPGITKPKFVCSLIFFPNCSLLQSNLVSILRLLLSLLRTNDCLFILSLTASITSFQRHRLCLSFNKLWLKIAALAN